MAAISHWHHLADGFNTSGLDFYDQVETAVKARDVPDATFRRVDFKEAGITSAKREYLRIRRGKIAFDLCAAPYGNSFFFSWWLTKAGPAHAWAWLLGFFVAVGFWLLLSPAAVIGIFSRGGGGCFVLLLWIGSLPVVLYGFGWMIREGILPTDEEDVLEIPVLGLVYRLMFNPFSYYQLDSAIMFQESVSRAVGEVMNGLLTEQGLKALEPADLTPTMRDLAQ